jgi:hypothetical protein
MTAPMRGPHTCRHWLCRSRRPSREHRPRREPWRGRRQRRREPNTSSQLPARAQLPAERRRSAATSRLRRLGRGPTRPQAQGRTRSHPTASSPEQRPAQPPQADLREGTHRSPGCATARGETALLPAIGGRLRSLRAALANHAAEDAGSPLWWVSGRHHSVFKLGRSVMPRSFRSARPRSRLSHHSTLTPITAGRGLSVMRGC